MRIDFSEPECSTCYRLRTSGVLSAQESEPVVSVTTLPVTSEPVQDLGHDSAAAGSGLIVEALGHESAPNVSAPIAFGSASAVASASSSSKQAVGQALSGSGGESTAPKPSTFGSNQAPISGSGGVSGTMQSPVQASGSSTTKFASAPATLFGDCVTSASSDVGFSQYSFLRHFRPDPSTSTSASCVWSLREPSPVNDVVVSRTDVGSSSASSSTNSGPNPSTTTIVFGTTPVTVSSLVGPAPTFKDGVALARTEVGSSPASSSSNSGPNSSSSTVVFGTTPVSVTSLFGPAPMFKDSVASARTDVGSSPASSSSHCCGFDPSSSSVVFGTTPVSVSSLFGPAQMFKDGVASARTDVGSSPASSSSHSCGFNPPTSTIVFGTTPVSVSSLFGPAQHSPTTKFANSSSCFPGFGVGYLPGSSSNFLGPNSPTNRPVLGSFERYSTAPAQDSITTTGVETSPPQLFGFRRATAQLPSSSSSSSNTSSSTLNGGSPHFAFPGQDSEKSRDELRWEYYNQGDKGGSRGNTTVQSRVNLWGKPFCPADVTTSSSNGVGQTNAAFTGPDFGPKPSTTTPIFGPFVKNMTPTAYNSVLAVKPSSPQPFGFNTATTTQLPSSSFSSSPAFSSNPNFGSQLSAFHGKGSRLTRYVATPCEEQHSGKACLLNSISASPFYRFKSHEELRWEDYSRGDKGDSRLNTAPQSRFDPWQRTPAFASFPADVTTSSFSPFGQASTYIGYTPAGVTTSSPSPFGQTNSAFNGSTFGSFPAGVTTSSPSPFGQTNSAFTGCAFGSFPAGVTTSSTNPFGQTNAGSAFGSFPAGVATSSLSTFGQTNGAFTGYGTVFPSSFAPSYTGVPAAFMSPIIWGGPQSLFTQRPHGTAAVSSPSSGCTACGAMTSSSAPAPFNFNCATTLARTATIPPVSSPMVFGTNFIAYPAQNFILLPFSAMSLH